MNVSVRVLSIIFVIRLKQIYIYSFLSRQHHYFLLQQVQMIVRLSITVILTFISFFDYLCHACNTGTRIITKC